VIECKCKALYLKKKKKKLGLFLLLMELILYKYVYGLGRQKITKSNYEVRPGECMPVIPILGRLRQEDGVQGQSGLHREILK
jgi:hypothetical protein